MYELYLAPEESFHNGIVHEESRDNEPGEKFGATHSDDLRVVPSLHRITLQSSYTLEM